MRALIQDTGFLEGEGRTSHSTGDEGKRGVE